MTLEEIDKKICYIFSSPLSLPSKRADVIVEYLKFIFREKNIEKVGLEIEDDLYIQLIKILPKEFKARKINFTLTWPIYDLNSFDDSLSGGQWKKLRKIRNKF